MLGVGWGGGGGGWAPATCACRYTDKGHIYEVAQKTNFTLQNSVIFESKQHSGISVLFSYPLKTNICCEDTSPAID